MSNRTEGNEFRVAVEDFPHQRGRTVEENPARLLMTAVLFQAVRDYDYMLTHGFVARESWLAPSESLRDASRRKWNNVLATGSHGCADTNCGGVEGMMATLDFFGGRSLDRLCELLGFYACRMRARMSRRHADFFAGKWTAKSELQGGLAPGRGWL